MTGQTEVGKKDRGLRYFNNWISLAGAVIALGSGFSFLLLFALDTFSHSRNAYMGILTYIVSPAFFILGVMVTLLGWYWHRRQIRGSVSGQSVLTFSLDLSKARDRRNFVLFTTGTMVFLLLSAFGSYKTYHVTESVEFCGEVCHTVMEPEFTTYQSGSHARVSCVACHIGSGAEWYVKSKLSGLYQVYSVIFKKYATPIDTPVHNLRPAQDTCEQCHWPQKFTGDLDRTLVRYLEDEENTPFYIRLGLKVGGGDPQHGPVGGFHWHVTNKVEFLVTDEDHLIIPWVRVTGEDGQTREYRTPGFADEVAAHSIHTMDCMDCHNRPAHIFQSPGEALDRAIYLGRLDVELPGLKGLALPLLTGQYGTVAEAEAAIAAGVREKYADDHRVPATTEVLQEIYRSNFFPLMKADWSHYPTHLGHKDFPGCFRCHDDQHTTADGRHKINMSNCNSCHAILAQGNNTADLKVLQADGLEFAHPGGDYGTGLCNECHTGASLY